MVTRETAAAVRDAVVAAIDPLEIILFGSVATAAVGNDLDLLIVTDDRNGTAHANVGAALRTVLGRSSAQSTSTTTCCPVRNSPRGCGQEACFCARS